MVLPKSVVRVTSAVLLLAALLPVHPAAAQDGEPASSSEPAVSVSSVPGLPMSPPSATDPLGLSPRDGDAPTPADPDEPEVLLSAPAGPLPPLEPSTSQVLPDVDITRTSPSLHAVDPETGHLFVWSKTSYFVHDSDGNLIRRVAPWGRSVEFSGDSFYVAVVDTSIYPYRTRINRYDRQTTAFIESWDPDIGEFFDVAVAGGRLWFRTSPTTIGTIDIETGVASTVAELDGVAGRPAASEASPDVLLVADRLYDVSAAPVLLHESTVTGSQLGTTGVWWTPTANRRGIEERAIADPTTVVRTVDVRATLQSFRALPGGQLAVQTGSRSIVVLDPVADRVLTAYSWRSWTHPSPGVYEDDASGWLSVREIGGQAVLQQYEFGPRVAGVDIEIFRPDLIDDVRVSGEGFTGVDDVRIGGVAVPFTVLEDVTIDLDISGLATQAGDLVLSDGVGSSEPWPLSPDPPTGQALLTVTALVDDGEGGEIYDYSGYCDHPGLPDQQFDFSLAAGETRLELVPAFSLCDLSQLNAREGLTSGRWDLAEGVPGPALFGHSVTVESMVGQVDVAFYNDPDATTVPEWVFVVSRGDPPPDRSHEVTADCEVDGVSRLQIEAGTGRAFDIGLDPQQCSFTIAGTSGAEVASVVVNDEITGGSTITKTVRASERYVVFYLDYGGASFDRPVVVGVPDEAIGSRSGAGLVHVFPTRAQGDPTGSGAIDLRQGRNGLTGGAEAGDEFGAAVATGDFDRDGWVDLAIGVPGEDLDGERDVGGVQVVYGGPSGYTSGRRAWFTQKTAGVPGAREAGDRFGASLAAFDHDGDGFDDLAIGHPGESIAGHAGAGAVTLIHGSASGLDGRSARSFHQGQPEIPGGPESGDGFGSSVAGDDGVLLIGAPGEDIGSRGDQGTVVFVDIVTGITATVARDENNAVSPSAGDRFGHAMSMVGSIVVIGVPGEDPWGVSGAGAAQLHDVHRDRSATLLAPGASSNVTPPQPGDGFGSSVARSRFGNWTLVGAPGRANGSGAFYATNRVLSSPAPSPVRVLIDQDSEGIPGRNEPGDEFGATVAVTVTGAWVVGVPGEDIGSRRDVGAIVALAGDITNLHQGSPGVPGSIENDDRFGTGLGG